jgi:hypothetical protein
MKRQGENTQKGIARGTLELSWQRTDPAGGLYHSISNVCRVTWCLHASRPWTRPHPLPRKVRPCAQALAEWLSRTCFLALKMRTTKLLRPLQFISPDEEGKRPKGVPKRSQVRVYHWGLESCIRPVGSLIMYPAMPIQGGSRNTSLMVNIEHKSHLVTNRPSSDGFTYSRCSRTDISVEEIDR